MRAIAALRLLAVFVIAAALGGCEGTGALGGIPAGAAGQMRVTTLIGPPGDVSDRVLSAVDAQAREVGLPLATNGSRPAEFSITGYMSAAGEVDGTEFAYVWDVFDKAGDRQHRIVGSVGVSDQQTDPWQTVDTAAAEAIARRIVAELKEWHDETVPPEPPLPGAPTKPETSAAPPVAFGLETPSPIDESAAVAAVLALAPPVDRPGESDLAAAGRLDNPAPPRIRRAAISPTIAPAARLPARAEGAIAIGTISGATGDGEESLRNAMGRAIKPYGFRAVASRPAAFVLTADVTATPPERQRQSVAIIWTLSHPDGRTVGTVRQFRSITAGALDERWETAAETAAAAAANGIATLIQTKL